MKELAPIMITPLKERARPAESESAWRAWSQAIIPEKSFFSERLGLTYVSFACRVEIGKPGWGRCWLGQLSVRPQMDLGLLLIETTCPEQLLPQNPFRKNNKAIEPGMWWSWFPPQPGHPNLIEILRYPPEPPRGDPVRPEVYASEFANGLKGMTAGRVSLAPLFLDEVKVIVFRCGHCQHFFGNQVRGRGGQVLAGPTDKEALEAFSLHTKKRECHQSGILQEEKEW